MNTVNAIAKVRFSTAKPQRVQLHKGPGLLAEMLCMEAGQKLRMSAAEWIYYVVMGRVALTAGGRTTHLATGQFAACAANEAHTIANAGEGRLVCLAIAPADRSHTQKG